ncbi:hypothetical protein ACHQM5_013273 [Ranunculus cassubicifolius]
MENWGRRTNLDETCNNGDDLVHLLQKIDWSKQHIEINKLLSLWMLGPHERDAVIAKSAFEHGDINYKALIELYCGRKSSHLLLIKQAYQAKFRRNLDHDIISVEPSSPYQKILIALATSHKSHQTDVSQHISRCDARRLYETGEGRRGAIEESVVLEIFSKRSIPQMKLTFFTYKQIYGHDYTKALKKGANGEFGDALSVVVKCLYKPSKYYGKILFGSIKGRIADKGALIRVLMSRDDTVMEEIPSEIRRKYGMELVDAICESIPSGDCRDFLVALVGTGLST